MGILLDVHFTPISEIMEVCGSDTDLTGSTAMFTSMDSDSDGLYDANLDCLWTIEADEAQIVKLHIQDIDIQDDAICNYDFLEVM